MTSGNQNSYAYVPVDTSRHEHTAFKKHQSSPEEQFWHSFRAPSYRRQVDKEELEFFAPITTVHSVTARTGETDGNNRFLVCSGNSVKVYDSDTFELRRSFNKFKSTATSATFRDDGKVVAAGEDNGSVVVFDATKGMLLRKLRLHREAVRSISWLDADKIVVVSDDKTGSIWDISTGELLNKLIGHDDHIRSCCVVNGCPLTVSYDLTARLWFWQDKTEDGRQVGKADKVDSVVFKETEPIEDVLCLSRKKQPSTFNHLFIVAVGNGISVWDSRKNASPVIVHKALHQRTVTSLAAAHGSASSDVKMFKSSFRLFTGSLDGFVAIHEFPGQDLSFGTLRTVTKLKYNSEVVDFSINATNTLLLCGLLSGEFAIRQRLQPAQTEPHSVEDGTLDYYQKKRLEQEQEQALQPEDIRKRKRKKALYTTHDLALKRFEYRTALSEALKSGKPHIVVSVLEELDQRRGLEAGIRNREPEDLESLVSFLVKFVPQPKYAKILVPVCEKVLEIYEGNPILEKGLLKLSKEINQELETQEHLEETCGVLELLLNS